MRRFAFLVPPEIRPGPANLVHVILFLLLENGIRRRASSGMYRHTSIAFADVDQVRADAADRSDFDHAGMALENSDQARNSAFGQHLIQDIRLTDPGLRPGRRRVVDHDRQRAGQTNLLQRKPGQPGSD
ncbi:hypothetical protein D3C74_403510 [compost metagenome]